MYMGRLCPGPQRQLLTSVTPLLKGAPHGLQTCLGSCTNSLWVSEWVCSPFMSRPQLFQTDMLTHTWPLASAKILTDSFLLAWMVAASHPCIAKGTAVHRSGLSWRGWSLSGIPFAWWPCDLSFLMGFRKCMILLMTQPLSSRRWEPCPFAVSTY